MTDLRIVTADGQRIEVSNTYLTPNQSTNLLGDENDTNGNSQGTLYNRSPAPSKREVKAAAGKQGRKQHNWKAQQGLNNPKLASKQPPKFATPKKAYNPDAPKDTNTTPTRLRSSSPFGSRPKSAWSTW
jgi:hypothetical protein